MIKDGNAWAMRRGGRLERMGSLLLCLALATASVSCKNESTKTEAPGVGQVVNGKVLLAGGKPLTKAQIVLTPKQPGTLPLYGTLGADGSFTLKAGGFAVGVSHGEFLVSIEPNGYVIGSKAKAKSLSFPAKYLEPYNGLTVTITPETHELPPIELK